MEHDTFGDDASCIIVDERGELVLSHIYDGFDETAVNLLRQEVMPVEKMPDDSISVEEMKQYGYKWGGMLPMREEAAAEVMKSCQIYRLYGDDTEGWFWTPRRSRNTPPKAVSSVWRKRIGWLRWKSRIRSKPLKCRLRMTTA